VYIDCIPLTALAPSGVFVKRHLTQHPPSIWNFAAVQQALTATGGDGSGYRFTVEYLYDSVGAMVALVDPTDNDVVYWRAHATDAAGRVNLESMGNGINTARVFDQATGLLEGISTGYGASSAIQTLTYAWDGMGNLSERHDDNQDLTETFVYDALNRLDYSQLDTGSGAATNLDLTYDAAGNITAKAMPLTQDGSTDWAYSYGGSQPHAVTAVSGTGSYTYDANGNQVTGPNGREIDWTAFNKPWRIEEGSSEHLFLYGPDRGRYQQIVKASGTWQSTTVYVGGLYERVTTSAGNAHRMHLMAGSGVVATIAADQPSGEFVINYFHRDHLGSVSAITDGNGELVVELSYDAHGMRRDPTDWTGPAPAGDVAEANAIVRYGFTGQEQLDAVNLVHMNGRVQDPVIGRFVSADPIRPFAGRYSYVDDRPLSATDPSGFSPATAIPMRTIADGAPNNGLYWADRRPDLTARCWGYCTETVDKNGNKVGPAKMCVAIFGGCVDARAGDSDASPLDVKRAEIQAAIRIRNMTQEQYDSLGSKIPWVQALQWAQLSDSDYGTFANSAIGRWLLNDFLGLVVGQIGRLLTPFYLVGHAIHDTLTGNIGSLAADLGSLIFYGIYEEVLGPVGYYGYYGGASWGVTQFGSDGIPDPLNTTDYASLQHDQTPAHMWDWVRNVWTGSAPGTTSNTPSVGPFGLPFQIVGTVGFGILGTGTCLWNGDNC